MLQFSLVLRDRFVCLVKGKTGFMFAGLPGRFRAALALWRGKVGYTFPCDDRLGEVWAKELKMGWGGWIRVG